MSALVYFLLALTALYYCILWSIFKRKATLERLNKEIFGPTTSLKELSDSLQENEVPSIEQKKIDLQTNTTMPPSAIATPTTTTAQPFPFFKKESQESNTHLESNKEAQLRHRIFAGSSLAKQGNLGTIPNNTQQVKDTIHELKLQALEAELDGIVEELETSSTIPAPDIQLTNSLTDTDLVGQLNQLFEKDYQDY